MSSSGTPEGSAAVPEPARGHRRPLRVRVARALALSLAAFTLALVLVESGLAVVQQLSLPSSPVIAAPAATGAVTVLCVGDSWTFGSGAEDPVTQNYPTFLQQLLDRQVPGKYRVINHGVPGRGSEDVVRILPQLLERHRPAVVVLLTGGMNTLMVEARTALSGKPLPPGPLARLRIVRILYALLGPDEQQSRQRLRQAMDRVHQVLLRKTAALKKARARHACVDLDQRPLPAAGCSSPTSVKKLKSLAARGVKVAELLRQDPGCAALLVAAARGSLDRGDAAGALRHARIAHRKSPASPVARLVLALALHGVQRRWTNEAMDHLDGVANDVPLFLHAQQLRIRARIALRDYSLCKLQMELRNASQRCPRDRWTGRLLAAIRADLGQEQSTLAARVARSLERVLGQIIKLCRRRGVRLVLLGYPRSSQDPCRAEVLQATSHMATAEGVPYVDLAPLLGTFRGGLHQPLYCHDGHPNGDGYRRIAKAVHGRLVAMELVTAAR